MRKFSRPAGFAVIALSVAAVVVSGCGRKGGLERVTPVEDSAMDPALDREEQPGSDAGAAPSGG